LALAGVALGAACALALAQALRKLLFEVSAVDPLTFIVVGVVVLAVGILACYLPARRATQADPMVALRAE
jgi:ABC-type antimicrobial peptide transport system permease subunit